MPADLPLTYPDLVCFDDLDPFASETTSDLQNLAQDIRHVIQELPNSNPDDPERGIGIMQYLSASEVEFRTLPSKIDSQLLKDSRVQVSHTTLTPIDGGGFRIDIKIGVGQDIIPLAYGVSGDGIQTI